LNDLCAVHVASRWTFGVSRLARHRLTPRRQRGSVHRSLRGARKPEIANREACACCGSPRFA
jgi:hypothetical protein